MFSAISERNKRRLYIGYYNRLTTPSLPVKFHTSLLMTPKNPDSLTTVKECWRYHVVDRSANGSKDEGHWIFEARKAYSRSSKLAGVVLLGKVPQSVSAEDIETIMKSVPRKATTAEDPSWRCRHWIWNALDTLVAEGIIPSLPSTAEVVWNAGASFIEGYGPITDNEPIPCCDTSGKSVPSEIGPMIFT